MANGLRNHVLGTTYFVKCVLLWFFDFFRLGFSVFPMSGRGRDFFATRHDDGGTVACHAESAY